MRGGRQRLGRTLFLGRRMGEEGVSESWARFNSKDLWLSGNWDGGHSIRGNNATERIYPANERYEEQGSGQQEEDKDARLAQRWGETGLASRILKGLRWTKGDLTHNSSWLRRRANTVASGGP